MSNFDFFIINTPLKPSGNRGRSFRAAEYPLLLNRFRSVAFLKADLGATNETEIPEARFPGSNKYFKDRLAEPANFPAENIFSTVFRSARCRFCSILNGGCFSSALPSPSLNYSLSILRL